MDFIDEFLGRYRKNTFYDQAARLVAQLVEQALQSVVSRNRTSGRSRFRSRED